ncbi:MAG: hypothetical protein HY698_16275 [Deltaproteobacteria bacterium]|nr:hypothetical protein [Deltaproteobacteria bacterium]
MSGDNSNHQRIEQVLNSLVERRLSESLERLEKALAAWREGKLGVLATHEEVLRHARRASNLSDRVVRAGLDGPAVLLRDALEAGLLDEEEFRALVGREPGEVELPASLDDVGDAAPRLPEKQSVLRDILEKGPALLQLDARREEVEVPPVHKGDARLVLRVGYGLQPPIPDLAFDSQGVRATLTFRGTPCRCQVPWRAVYAIVGEDGRGMVWPEDVPPDVAKDATDATVLKGLKEPPSGPKEPSPPRKGHLRLV